MDSRRRVRKYPRLAKPNRLAILYGRDPPELLVVSAWILTGKPLFEHDFAADGKEAAYISVTGSVPIGGSDWVTIAYLRRHRLQQIQRLSTRTLLICKIVNSRATARAGSRLKFELAHAKCTSHRSGSARPHLVQDCRSTCRVEAA